MCTGGMGGPLLWPASSNHERVWSFQPHPYPTRALLPLDQVNPMRGLDKRLACLKFSNASFRRALGPIKRRVIFLTGLLRSLGETTRISRVRFAPFDGIKFKYFNSHNKNPSFILQFIKYNSAFTIQFLR